MADNSSPEPAPRGPGRPFAKGTSGNPGGRPRKLRDLEAAIEEAHAGPKALAVIDKVHELAIGGDLQAAKVYLDRVLGPVRPRPDGTTAPVNPSRRSTEEMQKSVRSLIAGQLAALEEKAKREGLTEDERWTMTSLIAEIHAADQVLQNLRFGI